MWRPGENKGKGKEIAGPAFVRPQDSTVNPSFSQPNGLFHPPLDEDKSFDPALVAEVDGSAHPSVKAAKRQLCKRRNRKCDGESAGCGQNPAPYRPHNMNPCANCEKRGPPPTGQDDWMKKFVDLPKDPGHMTVKEIAAARKKYEGTFYMDKSGTALGASMSDLPEPSVQRGPWGTGLFDTTPAGRRPPPPKDTLVEDDSVSDLEADFDEFVEAPVVIPWNRKQERCWWCSKNRQHACDGTWDA